MYKPSKQQQCGVDGPAALQLETTQQLPGVLWKHSTSQMHRLLPRTLRQGSRMLPLLKLCLLENYQLRAAAEEASEAAAVAARAPSDAASAGLHPPGRASAASDVAGSDGASTKSGGPAEVPTAGTAAAVKGDAGPAPDSPATPARPGHPHEAPRPGSVSSFGARRTEPALEARRRPPSPPALAQDPHQRAVQQRPQEEVQAPQRQPSPGHVRARQTGADHAPGPPCSCCCRTSSAVLRPNLAALLLLAAAPGAGGAAVQPRRLAGPWGGAAAARWPAGGDALPAAWLFCEREGSPASLHGAHAVGGRQMIPL